MSLLSKATNLKTRQSILDICGYVMVALSSLTLTIISASFLTPQTHTEAAIQTASQELGPYTISMSTNSIAAIDITPTMEQSIYNSGNLISVTNGCPAGATIAITTDSEESNSLIRTGTDHLTKEIPATTGTTLKNNTWGYSIDNGQTYKPVPKLGQTEAIIYDASSAQNSATSIPFIFGVKTDSNMPAGSYTNSVVYTMTPKAGCIGYPVTWDMNGGTAHPDVDYPEDLAWGATIDLSQLTPTKDNYVFAGWSDGTTVFDGSSTVADINPNNNLSVNLTAQWAPASYNITYDLAGGSASNPASYNIETPTFELNAPAKAGYAFTGWTGSNGSTPQTTVSIAQGSTGAKSYTANWQPVPYNITYDLAGGSASNLTSYNIETATFTLNNPTRADYVFTGWTGSNGSTPQTTVSIAQGSTGAKSYTANWQAGPTTMQGFSCSSLAAGSTTTLKDLRDQNTYTVFRSIGADGACWMSQNLRLIDYTLNDEDSNVAPGYTYTIPNSTVGELSSLTEPRVTEAGSTNIYYGNLYNYAAASAGTIATLVAVDDAIYSICPKGWKLPTVNEWDNMLSAYSIVYGDATSGVIARQAPISLVYSGYSTSTGASGQGSVGNYWSASVFVYNGSVFKNDRFRYSISDDRGVRQLDAPRQTECAVRCVTQ